jgi:hypothetical protein
MKNIYNIITTGLFIYSVYTISQFVNEINIESESGKYNDDDFFILLWL